MIQHSLFEYFVNSLWQLPVLAAATWLLIRLARPSAAVQHALWLMTLALAVLLPVRGIDLRADTAGVPETGLASVAPSAAFPLQPRPYRHLTGTLAALRVHPLRISDRTIDWILELYAVSMAFSLMRLVHGYLAARRLAASAVDDPLTTLESTLLNVCAQRLHLSANRLPEVRFLHEPCATPMVVGICHPVLLLPAGMRHAMGNDFRDLHLTAIFSHELAHIRRRDYLANLVARIVSLPVAYHPASRVLHDRIRQTREMICDASAADTFGSGSSYARSLLAIADRMVRPYVHVEAVGLFDHARNSLEERIMNLTAERLPIRLSLRAARISVGAAILLAAAGTAATVHIKPAARLACVTPVVYAAQAQQPASQAAPTPAPEPAPKPESHPHPHVIVNGEVRDLTPEERAEMERDLAQSDQQVRKAIQLADGVSLVNSEELQKQIMNLKIQLNNLDTPEFRQQIIEAQKLSKLPEIKVDLSQLKLQLDSPELRAQLESAKALALQAQADANQRSAEARRQLDEASAAIAEARRQVSDAKVQEQLDRARKSIEDATKNVH